MCITLCAGGLNCVLSRGLSIPCKTTRVASAPGVPNLVLLSGQLGCQPSKKLSAGLCLLQATDVQLMPWPDTDDDESLAKTWICLSPWLATLTKELTFASRCYTARDKLHTLSCVVENTLLTAKNIVDDLMGLLGSIPEATNFIQKAMIILDWLGLKINLDKTALIKVGKHSQMPPEAIKIEQHWLVPTKVAGNIEMVKSMEPPVDQPPSLEMDNPF